MPVDGYRSQRNYSVSAMTWLTYIEKTENITLRHAWHPLGEKKLNDANVWADGYHSQTNTVYAFHGCFYHGHLACKKNPYSKQTKNPKLGKSMGDLHLETMRWNRKVKHFGYKLISIYECEWNEQISNSPAIFDHVSSLALSEPITPRSALYGGRTEAICLQAFGDQHTPIRYIDVVDIKYLYYSKNV